MLIIMSIVYLIDIFITSISSLALFLPSGKVAHAQRASKKLIWVGICSSRFPSFWSPPHCASWILLTIKWVATPIYTTSLFYYLLFCCFRSPVRCLMSLRTSSRSSTCKTISSKASGVRRLPSSFFFLLVSSPRFLTAGDWEFHVLEALDISNNNVFFSSLVLHTLPFFVPHLLSGEWSGPLLSLCAFVRLSRLFVPRIEQL